MSTTAPQPQAKKPPTAATLTPSTKKLTYTLTLKVEGDYKIPELKTSGVVNFASTLDGEITAEAAIDKYTASETVVDLASLPPAGHPLLVIMLKLDGATPKDVKPLRVTDVTTDHDPNNPGINIIKPMGHQELGLDGAKATVTYFADVANFAIPASKKLYIANDNPYKVKINVSIAYGPKV